MSKCSIVFLGSFFPILRSGIRKLGPNIRKDMYLKIRARNRHLLLIKDPRNPRISQEILGNPRKTYEKPRKNKENQEKPKKTKKNPRKIEEKSKEMSRKTYEKPRKTFKGLRANKFIGGVHKIPIFVMDFSKENFPNFKMFNCFIRFVFPNFRGLDAKNEHFQPQIRILRKI